jgi:hypothetical protein
MKTTRFFLLPAIAVGILTTQILSAQVTWSGADLINNNTNWSDGANWAGTPPGSGDAVYFFDAGGVASPGTVDNIVAASTTIASLKYGNTNNFHTTQINSGQTLTVTGGLTVGTETATANNDQIVAATVTGAGTLSVSGGNIIVRQVGNSSSSTRNAMLDMSGLSNFTANVNSIQLGVQIGSAPLSRASGAVILAMTNQITAGYILLHDNPASPVLGNNNLLSLGQTNAIYVDAITNGWDKSQYGTFIAFEPGLNNPVAYIRAADGVSRVSAWINGDESRQTTTANTANGTDDFSGGTVDALVDTMVLGKSAKTSGNSGTGTLIMGEGTMDVNTLQVGVQSASGATSAGKGFVTVGAPQGIVKVNTLMEVGKVTGGSGTANTFGVVTVTNGGTLQAKSIVLGATGQADVFTIDGGNLVVNDSAATVVGSSAIPLATLNMTNSSLRLSLDGSTATTPKIYVGTLNIPTTGGPLTFINIDAIANVSTTTTFSLINSTTRNGDPTTFVVGNLPSGYSATVTSTGTEIQLQVSPSSLSVTSAIVTNSVATGTTWKIAISDMSNEAGWNNGGSYPITLNSVGPTSNLGKSVTSDGTFIYYNAPVNAEDFFTYTITDGHSMANGTAYLEATNGNDQTYNISSTVVNGGGSVTLSGAGIPNRTNVIERATTLTAPIPWTPINTNVTDGTGHWQFTDPTPTDPAFYRSVTQP